MKSFFIDICYEKRKFEVAISVFITVNQTKRGKIPKKSKNFHSLLYSCVPLFIYLEFFFSLSLFKRVKRKFFLPVCFFFFFICAQKVIRVEKKRPPF